MSHQAWHLKSDDELRAIVRGIWEGSLVGTWQLEGYAEMEQAFPGFDTLQSIKSAEADGQEIFSSTPEAALDLARLPLPVAAYARHPRTPPDAPGTWDILSSEEWQRLRVLLGYPPR